MRYEVVGSRPVAGVAPGGVVEFDESVDVRALIKAGHVAEVEEKNASNQSGGSWDDDEESD